MKTKVSMKTVITLELTVEEARWLRGVVQNPIGIDPLDEPAEDKEMRRVFWDALDDFTL